MKSNLPRILAVIAAILAAGLLVEVSLVAGRRVATLYAFDRLIACAGVPLALLGGLTWFTTWRRGEHHLPGRGAGFSRRNAAAGPVDCAGRWYITE